MRLTLFKQVKTQNHHGSPPPRVFLTAPSLSLYRSKQIRGFEMLKRDGIHSAKCKKSITLNKPQTLILQRSQRLDINRHKTPYDLFTQQYHQTIATAKSPNTLEKQIILQNCKPCLTTTSQATAPKTSMSTEPAHSLVPLLRKPQIPKHQPPTSPKSFSKNAEIACPNASSDPAAPACAARRNRTSSRLARESKLFASLYLPPLRSREHSTAFFR